MPTYQYACTSCGEQLEVVQKFSDDPLTVCPSCSGTLRKVFTPVGVVFKGSGFYKTDSRSTSGKKSSESAKADKPDKTSNTDTSTTSTDKSGNAGSGSTSGGGTSGGGTSSGGTSGGSGGSSSSGQVA